MKNVGTIFGQIGAILSSHAAFSIQHFRACVRVATQAANSLNPSARFGVVQSDYDNGLVWHAAIAICFITKVKKIVRRL